MRGMRSARLAAVALLAGATLATTGTGTVAPAAAQTEPTITVTPSTGLADGATTEVTTTGFTGLYGVFQCAASALDDLENANSGPCAFRHIELSGTDPDTVEIAVSGAFTGFDGSTVRCGRTDGDCAVVAWSPTTGGPRAGTAISMLPTPLALRATAQEAGHPVSAIVTVPPGTGAQIADCLVPAGADLASSHCSPPQQVQVGTEGLAELDVTLVASVPGPAGDVTCDDGNCAVTLFDGDGTTLGSVPVTTYAPDGPIQLTLANGGLVFPFNDANVAVDGIRNDEFDIAVCAASVVTTQDVVGGPCRAPQHVGPITSSTHYDARVLVPRTFTGVDGSAVDCEPLGACVIAARTAAGAFDAAPIRLHVTDTVTLTPPSGLLDGQTIAVDATGLEPSTDYRVLRCDRTADWGADGRIDDDLCDMRLDDAPVVHSSAEGTLATSVDATQRFQRADGAWQYCRDNCAVVVTLFPQGWPELAHPRPYAMATGSLEATPSSGLSDGQSVDVAGTDLMPSYDGPLWWIVQTGQWALGQCGAAVLDEASVASVFRECTVPPGAGAVTVSGSTVDASFEAQAGFTSLTGKEVDCTTGPDACVALLTRVEQDAGVTLVADPLSFA